LKKHLIILFGITFLFFSCASKPEGEIEIPENYTESGTELLEEAASAAESELNESAAENDILNSKDNSDNYPELEEIEEPEVTDLEYVEEVESSDSKAGTEAEDDKNYELVPQEEVLAKTESVTVENSEAENKETSKTNTQNSSSVSKSNNKKDRNTVSSEDDDIIDLTESNSSDDILEILDENSDSTPEEEPVIIIPSRKVSLKIGQTLEVMYPGTGWIYMGTTDSTKDFTFLGKKLGTQNTKFTFTAKAEGTKILHFYKNDTLTNRIIDDYLEVEITGQKDTTKATISAPAYKQPVPVSPKQKKTEPQVTVTEPAPSSTDQTSSEPVKSTSSPAVKPASAPVSKPVQTAAPAAKKTEQPKVEQPKVEEIKETSKPSEVLSDKDVQDLLKQAHALYENKDYKTALNKLAQFFEYGTKNRDEAYYLQGQIYEASGTTKNIKLAIDAYKNVTKNYPASPYWDDANKRIIYLTKFYLEGR